MSTRDGNGYRVMFWASVVVGAVCVGRGYMAGRSIDPRLYEPHEMSQLRGVNYPYTIEVFGYKYRGKTGDYIDDHILAYGAYEKDVLYFMRDYVQALGNPDAVFLDVGACEGQHSLFMSRHVKQVHAFEPYPPAAERCRGLVRLNGFENIRVHEVGLGAADARVPFYAPPAENAGSGTFLPEHKDGPEAPVGSFRVVAGDDWLGPLDLRSLDVIKIDVEGFEKNVLQGLSKSLARFRPVLVVEVTTPPRGTIGSVEALKRLLPPDYQVLRFQNDRAQVITGSYVLEEMRRLPRQFPYVMVAAFPKERGTLIRRDRSEPAPAASRRVASRR